MACQQPEESSQPAGISDRLQTSQLIDWFAEGQSFAVEFAGIAVTVRFVCRKGRRARIAITGPAGTVFRALDIGDIVRLPDRTT